MSKQARVITKEEFKRVIAVIKTYKHSARNIAIFYLSYLAGLRSCEIAGLKLEDVVDEQGQVKTEVLLRKEQTKGSEANTIYFNKALRKQLKIYIENTRFRKSNTALIQSQKGSAFRGVTITQLFSKFYKLAGVYGASGHSGRRAYISKLANNSVNIRVIQRLARHKHINTTMIYIDVNSYKLQNAVELVEI